MAVFDSAVFDSGVFDAGALLRDERASLEYGAVLARDEGIPVEWAATTPLQALLRDEAFPVEWQQTTPAFVFFNWLAAGAGAPWPPAPPFLARERGTGRVWWTGWSRARWAPGAPEIPLVPGRVLRCPQPGPRPVPTRRRESSRAVGFWGGRSRSRFTPSPWLAVARDDDEVMLLRRLLRGW